MAHIGCRVNDETDKDIIEAVAKYADKTAGIKELLRLGIRSKEEKRLQWGFVDNNKSAIAVYLE